MFRNENKQFLHNLNSNDEDDIDNLIENLNNFKLEDNQEYKYYLCQLFKDIDLDSIKNEIINELE